MSLINKMLKDLETRDRAASPTTPEKAAYEDLRPVRYARIGSSHTRIVLISVLLVVALAAGAFYFFGPGILEGKSTAVAPMAANTSPVARAPDPGMETPAEQVVPPVPTAALEPTPQPGSPSKTEVAVAPVSASPKPLVKQAKSAPPVAPAAKAGPLSTPNSTLATAPARAVSPVRAAKPATVPKLASEQQQTKDQESSSSGQAVMEKRDRLLSPQEQAEARYREAAQLIAQGRAEDARATLAAALASYPGHHKARELAAALALQNGRLREAQDLLTQGLKLAPDHLPFSQLLARIFIEQGAEAQAIATLEGSRVAGAGNADYLSFLAALYQRAGRHADAVKTYRETIALRAQDARAWLGLGISLEATQDAPSAAEAYRRTLQTGGLDATLMQYAQQRLAAIKK